MLRLDLHDYRAGFVHLRRWMTAQGHTDPSTLSAGDLKGFLAWLRTTSTLQGKLLSPKTVYNIWVALKSFYRWWEEESGRSSPMAKVPAPKAPVPIIEPLSRDQLAAVLKACDSTRPATSIRRQSFAMRRDTALRDRAIVLMLLDAGLRAKELCALTVGDVDLASRRVVVHAGKGGKGRISYLGEAARRSLWRYLSQRTDATPREPLFVVAVRANH